MGKGPKSRLDPAGPIAHKVAYRLLAGLSLLGALGAGGAFISALDLLNYAAPLYLIASACLLVLCLIRRPVSPALAVIAGLGLVGSGILVLPEISSGLRGGNSDPKPSQTITVLTQNLWTKNRRPDETVAAILEARADIVVVQEAMGSSHDVPALLAQTYPYRADSTPDGDWCSMAILSKYPIVKWSYHYGDWTPPAWDRLGYVRATIAGPAGPFEIFGTQLVHPDLVGAAKQQMQQLVDEVAQADPATTLLVGDLNQVPWSFSLRWLDQHTPLHRQSHGIATWPNRLPFWTNAPSWPIPFLPIDQIYAGSDWKLVGIRRAPRTGSDHFGLLATLVFQPKSAQISENTSGLSR